MGLNKPQEAFIAQLYSEMFQKLFCYARNSLQDDSLAEEAVQDTFRIACAKIDDVIASENSQGWLMQTLKYIISNTRRELATLNRYMVSYVSIYDKAFAEAMTREVDLSHRVESDSLDILYSDMLSPEEYELMKLIVLHRYTIAEASRELGIALETGKKRLQRGRIRVREKFPEK